MARSRVGRLSLGSTTIGLLLGAVAITAQIDRPGSPATMLGPVDWRFSEPQPEWKPELPLPGLEMAELNRTTDALRVTLPEGSLLPNKTYGGGMYVDLRDWRREEWAELVVRARTTSSVTLMSIGLDPREDVPDCPTCLWQRTFHAVGGVTPIVRDGLVHTYRIHLDWGSQRKGPWRRVGFQVQARSPGSIDILSVRVVPAAAGQGRVIETNLEPSQLKSDFALFRKALEEAHPALYRYTPKREMDTEFARAEGQLTRPMTVLRFRNVLAPVLAAIKDGHTGFSSYQGDEIRSVIDSARQFPLALTFDSTRGYVLVNQGLDTRVKPGMEVLAINGTPLGEILNRILSNLTSDGDVRTWPMYQLGMRAGDGRSRSFFQVGGDRRTGFSAAYRLYIADPKTFRTTLRDPRTHNTIVVDLKGVDAAEALANVESNPVNRDVIAGFGTVLTGIGSGGQESVRYLDGEDTAVLADLWGATFPDVLKKVFAELRSRGTKNLIIDARGNTGGFDQYPVLLFSYLSSAPFRAVEGNRMNTYRPSFWAYTGLGEIDPVTDSYFGSAAAIWKPDPRGGWFMTEKYPTIGMQNPTEPHFGGAVYVLIDGGSFSASSFFTALVDHYNRGVFIGEETGGVGTGGTGGSDIGPTLPESHLHFRMSMESFTGLIGKGDSRRGTLPDYRVLQTVDDLEKGRDTVLEFTRELIRSGKGRQPPRSP